MKWVGEIRSQTQWSYDPLESAQLREVAVGKGGDWMVDGFITGNSLHGMSRDVKEKLKKF